MLKIWYYGNIDYMKDAPSYFDNVYEDEWIEDTFVKDTWTGYVSDGDAILAEPEDYMTLR